jgi:hypothetical protein
MHTQRLILGISLVAGMLIVASHSAFAQSGPSGEVARLTGQIRDVCGRVIPGVTVTLSNPTGLVFFDNDECRSPLRL